MNFGPCTVSPDAGARDDASDTMITGTMGDRKYGEVKRALRSPKGDPRSPILDDEKACSSRSHRPARGGRAEARVLLVRRQIKPG